MKRAGLYGVILLACGVPLWASVEFDFSYDVYLYSSYRQDGTDFVKMEQAHNEDVDTYLNSAGTPYNGGSVFQYGEDVEKYQLAALYWDRTGISNWTTNDMVGTLSVGTSVDFPVGSLVPFEVFYEYVEHDNNTVFPNTTSGISFWNDNFTHEIYSVSGETETTDTIYLTAGQDYGFYAWYSAGSQVQRFSGFFLGGIQYDFQSVPEPATVAFLFAGACALLKRKKANQ